MIHALLFIMLLSCAAHAADLQHQLQPSIAMVTVPEGCFQMGDRFGDGYFNEKPLHEVCVSAFSICTFQITRGEFARFVKDTGFRTDAEKGDGCYIYDGASWKKDLTAHWRAPGFAQGDDHPVVCVSWHDATAYARWLTGKSGRLFRLPTEAEWEYAASSGGKQQRFSGGDDAGVVAWYAGNSGNGTHAVGQKQPNGFGIYDMSGNVWQWTADWYGEKYYRESPRHNPQGPTSGNSRIFRGGSWFYDEKGLRVSYRDFFSADYRSSHLGFRLVSTPLNPEGKK